MNEFDILMDNMLDFLDVEKKQINQINEIKATSEKQRQYNSGHVYDLEKFGLDEKMIRTDCAKIYDTLLT